MTDLPSLSTYSVVSLFILSSYVMSLTAGIILMNLCCNISSFDTSFLMCGVMLLYKKTINIYNFTMIFSSRFTNDLRIMSNIPLAVSAAVATCFQYLNFPVK